MNDCAAHRSASQSGAVGCAKTPLARGNTRTAETRMYLINEDLLWTRPSTRRPGMPSRTKVEQNKSRNGTEVHSAQAPKRGSMGIRERGEPRQRSYAGDRNLPSNVGLLPITPCAARTARRLRAPRPRARRVACRDAGARATPSAIRRRRGPVAAPAVPARAAARAPDIVARDASTLPCPPPAGLSLVAAGPSRRHRAGCRARRRGSSSRRALSRRHHSGPRRTASPPEAVQARGCTAGARSPATAAVTPSWRRRPRIRGTSARRSPPAAAAR